MLAVLKELRPRIRWQAELFQAAGARGVVDAEDLERAAEVGIWRARRRWDPERSSWKTYAAAKALWAMKDELRETDHLSRLTRHRVSAGLVKAPELQSMDAGQIGVRAEDLVDLRRGPAAEAVAADLWRWVRKVLGPRRSSVVEGYFRQEETLLEIAFRMRMSESRACQLLAQALRMLRRRRKRALGEEIGR